MSTLPTQPKACTVIHRHTRLNKLGQPKDLAISMNEKHSAIINTYNAFIDNLICDEHWTENKEHEENRLVICGSDYQLSASRYFLFQGIPYTFTVELKLTDKTLKPNKVTLTLGQRAGGESSKSFDTKLLTPMMDKSPQDMTDFINARVVKVLKRFKGQKIAPFSPKTFQFDLELIENSYLAEYWENISDVKIIGFDGYSNDSKFYVGFKSDGIKHTKSFYFYEYFVDVSIKKSCGDMQVEA